MISIRRTAPPPPDLKGTVGKPSPGEIELREVIEFYANKGNLIKAFKYKAYKSKTIVEELGKLFFGKCAYCESKYQATQPVDVEHYRPKGGVMVAYHPKKGGAKKNAKKSNPGEPQIKLQKPGYYWLAASWDNLLPACIDCNRERNQKVPHDADPTRFTVIKVGKGNNFPLADETKRRLTPRSRRQEEPLILDPTSDQPDKHLEFTEDGIVRPTLIKRKTSIKGEVSIRVYALQRIGLVQERRARAKLVLAQIERLRELIADLDKRPEDKQLEKRLERELQELKRYTRPEEEYAGMARQLIKKFFGSLKNQG